LKTILQVTTANEQVQAKRFATMYAQHGERIYRFCFRLCGRQADAEDLTQEVFLAAFQGLNGFAERSSLTTWLYKIALYRWNRLRPQWQPDDVSWEDTAEAEDAQSDPSRTGLHRISLDAALAQLPDDLHDAFLLIKAEGLKYREAAQVLDVPQGTVQWRVSEAVRRLRALLNDGEKENRDED